MNTLTRRLLVVTILLGGFLSTLTETILNNALPTIMQVFKVSQSMAQWLSTGYIMIVGIILPVSGYFFNRFPLRPLFLSTLGVFLAGTTLSAFAPNFFCLLIGRMIQAISVGISMPLTQNVMTLIYPPEKRGAAMGMAAVVIILGPAIGPTLSGWIVDHYSWRVLFASLLPVTLIIIVLGLFALHNINKRRKSQLDGLSLFLSTLGFGLLLYGFSNIGSIGGIDLTTIVSILAGIIGVALFVWHQLKLQMPMLEMRVFASPSFTKTTILAGLINIAMLGTELIIPLYLQSVRGISALVSGIMLLPGAILMGMLTPIAGRLFDQHGIKNLAIVGFGILSAATLPMLQFNATTNIVWIVVLYALRMGAISLVMMPVTTSGINALPPRLIVDGNTVVATFRQIASSLGTAALVTISAIVSQGQTMRTGLTQGYQVAFGVTLAISLIGWGIAFTLKNRTVAELE